MKRLALLIATGLTLTASSSHAQFATFSETTESRWGATFYGGGDIDSLGNAQVGFRVSYRVLQVKPLARLSPEIGLESRKNFVLFKAGGRLDSREIIRLSAFVGGGFLRIQDFSNTGDKETDSDGSPYFYYGGKFRLPGLGGIPILGKILGGLPVEGTSVFVAQEINALDDPVIEGSPEFGVNEWYSYSVQIGIMVGSASGWYQ